MAISSTSKSPHLDAFLEAAYYFVGLRESGYNTFNDSKGYELIDLWGSDFSGTAWCAIFICACARKAGILGVLIQNTCEAGWIQEGTVYNYGGTWIEGPAFTGGEVIPQPGDILSIVNSDYGPSYGHAAHVGLVVGVEDGKVHTIEGNTHTAEDYTDGVHERWRSLDNPDINGYARPDWAAVGDIVGGVTGTVGPLYKTRNDRHDMTIRQVGYLNGSYEFTNSQTNIPLSIINYTTVLGDLYDMFLPYTSAVASVDTSQLPQFARVSVDYFISIGYSASAACAITGCLKTYSGLQTAFVKDFGTIGKSIQRLQGIAAWNNKRWEWVKSRLTVNTRYDLSSQLQCVSAELLMYFPDLVEAIKNMDLNVVSVQRATYMIISVYNDYFVPTSWSVIARDNATELYNQLIITRTNVIGNSTSSIYDEHGNILECKKSVSVPSYVDQTGILYDADFTSYSYQYHHWPAGSMQRNLADEWAWEKFPYSKGIAMIDGYYCVATKRVFGVVGDIIVVTLEDGTSFSAIICDEKGSDAASDWGHPKPEYKNAISIIEWERVKTDSWGAVMSDEGTVTKAGVDYIGYGDGDVQIPEWFKKKVISIANYGCYFN